MDFMMFTCLFIRSDTVKIDDEPCCFDSLVFAKSSKGTGVENILIPSLSFVTYFKEES